MWRYFVAVSILLAVFFLVAIVFFYFYSGRSQASAQQSKISIATFSLSNGLKVFVRHQQSPTFSIAVAVNVGTQAESPQSEGLTHFFEHYAIATAEATSGYEKFMESLSIEGGRLSAATGFDKVTFGFMAGESLADAALKTFSSVFKNPQIVPGAVDKTANIIAGELITRSGTGLTVQPGYQADICAAVNSQMPECSVKNVPVQIAFGKQNENSVIELLQTFHKNSIFSENMQLVVLTAQPIDKIKASLEKYFSYIPSRVDIPAAQAAHPSPKFGYLWKHFDQANEQGSIFIVSAINNENQFCSYDVRRIIKGLLDEQFGQYSTRLSGKFTWFNRVESISVSKGTDDKCYIYSKILLNDADADQSAATEKLYFKIVSEVSENDGLHQLIGAHAKAITSMDEATLTKNALDYTGIHAERLLEGGEIASGNQGVLTQQVKYVLSNIGIERSFAVHNLNISHGLPVPQAATAPLALNGTAALLLDNMLTELFPHNILPILGEVNPSPVNNPGTEKPARKERPMYFGKEVAAINEPVLAHKALWGQYWIYCGQCVGFSAFGLRPEVDYISIKVKVPIIKLNTRQDILQQSVLEAVLVRLERNGEGKFADQFRLNFDNINGVTLHASSILDTIDVGLSSRAGKIERQSLIDFHRIFIEYLSREIDYSIDDLSTLKAIYIQKCSDSASRYSDESMPKMLVNSGFLGGSSCEPISSPLLDKELALFLGSLKSQLELNVFFFGGFAQEKVKESAELISTTLNYRIEQGQLVSIDAPKSTAISVAAGAAYTLAILDSKIEASSPREIAMATLLQYMFDYKLHEYLRNELGVSYALNRASLTKFHGRYYNLLMFNHSPSTTDEKKKEWLRNFFSQFDLSATRNFQLIRTQVIKEVKETLTTGYLNSNLSDGLPVRMDKQIAKEIQTIELPELIAFYNKRKWSDENAIWVFGRNR